MSTTTTLTAVGLLESRGMSLQQVMQRLFQATSLRQNLCKAFLRSKALAGWLVEPVCPEAGGGSCGLDLETDFWLSSAEQEDRHAWKCLVTCLPCTERGHQVLVSFCKIELASATSTSDRKHPAAAAAAGGSEPQVLLHWPESMLMIDLGMPASSDTSHERDQEWSDKVASELARMVNSFNAQLLLQPWVVVEFPRLSARQVQQVHRFALLSREPQARGYRELVPAHTASARTRTRTGAASSAAAAAAATSIGVVVETKQQVATAHVRGDDQKSTTTAPEVTRRAVGADDTDARVPATKPMVVLPENSSKNARGILNDLKTRLGLVVQFAKPQIRKAPSRAKEVHWWLVELTVRVPNRDEQQQQQQTITVQASHASQSKAAEQAALWFFHQCFASCDKHAGSVWKPVADMLQSSEYKVARAHV